jgi:hypothetical protein
MSNEETAYEPGPEVEGEYGPEEDYVPESNDLEADAAVSGDEAYPAKSGPTKQDRTPWIAGGVAVAVLVAITCCLIAVAAFLVGRGDGGGGDTVPTLPPINVPTNTPAAPVEPSPTPTPSDEPQPTPTNAVGPEAVIGAPDQAQVGERVSFDGSQSKPGTSAIARYDWDFGDGKTGSGEVVRYVYTNPGEYVVTLTVTDEDGLTDTAPAQITILSEATAEPTDTPQPTETPLPTPVIDDFEVDPQAIALGQCVKVTWETSGGTSWVNVLRNDDYIWENAPLSGSLQDCPDKAGDYRYRVVAWNPQDDRVREDVQVTVSE